MVLTSSDSHGDRRTGASASERGKDIVKGTIALLIASVLTATMAHAQAPATSFVELSSRLSIGETVFVTNYAGKTMKGKVRRVSDTSLVLQSAANDVTLAATDVQRITRRGHTLRNGALTGLIAGFAAGALTAAALGCSPNFCPAENGAALGGLFGVIGMGVGAAAGASLRREQILFER